MTMIPGVFIVSPFVKNRDGRCNIRTAPRRSLKKLEGQMKGFLTRSALRDHLEIVFLLVLLGGAATADAQVQPQIARRYFEEAAKLCERDAGRLWGMSLCGPIVIVDQATGTRATSQPEPDGPLPRFSGFADGPVQWGGVRWFSFPLSFLPENNAEVRQQVLLHGLFHRIQPELGLMTEDGFNEHLDTLEGRVWMRLEWRALRRAVESSGSRQAEAIA